MCRFLSGLFIDVTGIVWVPLWLVALSADIKVIE
jgi:hypothetical protein